MRDGRARMEVTNYADEAMAHRDVLKVFSGLMLVMFLGALDQTIVSTAGPTIAGEFGDLDSLPWIFTSYMLASTVTVPIYGKLSDLYGRRPLLQIAIMIFVVGSVAVGLAQNMSQIIAFRGVQGLGAGALVPLSLSVIGDIVTPRARGRYMGYVTSVFVLASIMGPLAGGFFVDNLTWRWGFFINLPMSVVALIVIRRNLPSASRRSRVAIDYSGAALLTLAVSSFLLTTVFVGQGQTLSKWTIGSALLGVAALVGLGSVERRVDEPIVPLELFSDSIFNVSSALGFLMGLSMFGAIVFLPLFLQVSQGMSATQSGLTLVPMMAAVMVTSVIAGRLISHFGRYKIFVIVGTGLILVGTGGLTTIEVGTSRATVGALVACLGAGIGTGMPVLTTAVQNAVPGRHLGAATSLTQFFRSIGGIFGVSAFGVILASRVSTKLGQAALGDTDVGSLIADPEKVAALEEPTRTLARAALADGVVLIIMIATILAFVAFLTSFWLRDAELSDDLPTAPRDPVTG